MTTTEEIHQRIAAALPGSEIEVSEPRPDHFEARVVSASFQGRSLVEQHQLVYGPLKDKLATGELHALALKTYTPEQWARARPQR